MLAEFFGLLPPPTALSSRFFARARAPPPRPRQPAPGMRSRGAARPHVRPRDLHLRCALRSLHFFLSLLFFYGAVFAIHDAYTLCKSTTRFPTSTMRSAMYGEFLPVSEQTPRLAAGGVFRGIPSGACSPTSDCPGASTALPAPPPWGSLGAGGRELEIYDKLRTPGKKMPPRLRWDSDDMIRLDQKRRAVRQKIFPPVFGH